MIINSVAPLREGGRQNLIEPGMVWYGIWHGMVDVCDGYQAAEASRSAKVRDNVPPPINSPWYHGMITHALVGPIPYD